MSINQSIIVDVHTVDSDRVGSSWNDISDTALISSIFRIVDASLIVETSDMVSSSSSSGSSNGDLTSLLRRIKLPPDNGSHLLDRVLAFRAGIVRTLVSLDIDGTLRGRYGGGGSSPNVSADASLR